MHAALQCYISVPKTTFEENSKALLRVTVMLKNNIESPLNVHFFMGWL